MNRLVHIDFRKWVTHLHWQFTMNYLAEDEWGLWLWAPAGSKARRGNEPPQTFNRNNVKLVVPGAWWTAIWNDGGEFDLYIDTIAPAAIGPDRVTMVDLDLDLVRSVDGSVKIDDEDEFADHRVRYGYSEYLVERTVAETRALRPKLEAREEPFGEVGDRMMEQARALYGNMKV